VQWTVGGAPRVFRVGDARSRVAEPLRLGRVRLFAAPGWESRFAVQALEESGWTVDARVDVSPSATVTLGRPASLDTADYSAVIALDSTAWSSAGSIVQFVRDGGGAVFFPEALRASSLAALRAGASLQEQAGIPGALLSDAPREGLALVPIDPSAEAAILERSNRPGEPVAVAARRVGAGRVLQVGWQQSWEWRMLGGEQAVDAHRDWWRSLLQRVAYASLATADTLPGDDWEPLPGAVAPYADLVARVGPPDARVEEATAPPVESPQAPPLVLAVIAMAALLAEWWSRRLRGAK
jgi:hypothetical protein